MCQQPAGTASHNGRWLEHYNMKYRHKTSPILLFYNQEASSKLMAISFFVWLRLPLPLCKTCDAPIPFLLLSRKRLFR